MRNTASRLDPSLLQQPEVRMAFELPKLAGNPRDSHAQIDHGLRNLPIPLDTVLVLPNIDCCILRGLSGIRFHHILEERCQAITKLKAKCSSTSLRQLEPLCPTSHAPLRLQGSCVKVSLTTLIPASNSKQHFTGIGMLGPLVRLWRFKTSG